MGKNRDKGIVIYTGDDPRHHNHYQNNVEQNPYYAPNAEQYYGSDSRTLTDSYGSDSDDNKERYGPRQDKLMLVKSYSARAITPPMNDDGIHQIGPQQYSHHNNHNKRSKKGQQEH